MAGDPSMPARPAALGADVCFSLLGNLGGKRAKEKLLFVVFELSSFRPSSVGAAHFILRIKSALFIPTSWICTTNGYQEFLEYI